MWRELIQKEEPDQKEEESRVAVPLLTKHGRAVQGLKYKSLLITILPIPFVYQFKPFELTFLNLTMKRRSFPWSEGVLCHSCARSLCSLRSSPGALVTKGGMM